MIGSSVLIFFFIMQAIQVSGGALQFAYTSKSFSVASAAAFMLYRYAAGSSHSCLRLQVRLSPRHFFSIAFAALYIAAGNTNTDYV